MKILLALFALSAAQSAEIGRKLNVVRDQNDNLRLGVQYMTGVRKMISITFSVRGRELVGDQAGPITPVIWAAADREGNRLTNWFGASFPDSPIQPDSTQALSLALNDAEAASVIRAMRTGLIVVSLRGSADATAHLELAELCTTHPEKFVNLDTFQRGCP